MMKTWAFWCTTRYTYFCIIYCLCSDCLWFFGRRSTGENSYPPISPPILRRPRLLFSSNMSTRISEDSLDTAAAAVAGIVRSHLTRTIGQSASANAELRTDVTACYGVRWNRAVITAIATNRTNRVLAFLRNSGFPRTEYERLAAFLLESY